MSAEHRECDECGRASDGEGCENTECPMYRSEGAVTHECPWCKRPVYGDGTCINEDCANYGEHNV